MKNPIKMSLLLIINIIVLSACEKSQTGKSSPARVARGADATQPYSNQPNGTYPPNTQNPTQQPGGGSTAPGMYNIGSQWVFLQSTDYNSFLNSVKGLVSASMDPSGLGSLSNYGDVALIGYIDMNQQYSINSANCRFRMEIWDDYARSGSASAIAFSFNSLSNYSVNGNQINLVFQDAYGQLFITGQIGSGEFYGTVSFKNYKSFDGSTNMASGTLGTFKVPYCGFFRCQ